MANERDTESVDDPARYTGHAGATPPFADETTLKRRDDLYSATVGYGHSPTSNVGSVQHTPSSPSKLDCKTCDTPDGYVPSGSVRSPPPPDLFRGIEIEAGPSTGAHHGSHGSGGGGGGGTSTANRRRLSLAEFRKAEGPAVRSYKLKALWHSLPDNLPAPSSTPTATSLLHLPGQGTAGTLSPERLERLNRLYEEELSNRVSLESRDSARLWGGADDLPDPSATGATHASSSKHSQGLSSQHPQLPSQQQSPPPQRSKKNIAWKDFRKFLWEQEEHLWDIFCDLDQNCDGRLDPKELRGALTRSGIDMSEGTLDEFVRFLATSSPTIKTNPSSQEQQQQQQQQPTPSPSTDNPAQALPPTPSGKEDSPYVTFAEFRDFLLLLPRKASFEEIYKYYQVQKRISDGRGAARINMDGDLNVSFPRSSSAPTTAAGGTKLPPATAAYKHPKVSAGPAVDGKSSEGRADPPGKQKHAVISRKTEEVSSGTHTPEPRSSGGTTSDVGTRVHERDHIEQAGQMETDEDEEDEEGEGGIGADVAWKFLLAGGIAGAGESI